MIPGGMHLSWADHLIAILITFVVPAYALLRTQPSLGKLRLSEQTRISLYYANSATLVMVALVITIVWMAQGRSFSDLGFTEAVPGKFWVWLVALFSGLYLADLLANLLIEKWKARRRATWEQMSPILPRNHRELFHFSITVALSAAVCEEVIYRGFFIQYCLALFPPNSIGEYSSVVLPAIVFSAVHRYQGWSAVAKIFLLSCLFGMIYIRSQSLIPLIILHYLIDLLGGMLSKYVFFAEKEKS